MGGFIKKLRQSLKYLAAIKGAFILALLFWPVPIEPEIYETGPQTAGLPPFEHNNALAASKNLIRLMAMGQKASHEALMGAYIQA